MMKTALATMLLGSNAEPVNIHRVKREIVSAGQSGLMEIIATYNPSFSRQKYFNGYGCHCVNMLDSNHLDHKFTGPPVDRIDKACKTYTDCLRCAKTEHGDSCENSHYYWKRTGEEPVTCIDNAGSCERSLCECNKLFAQEHLKSHEDFFLDFHHVWSKQYAQFPFEIEENCGKHARDPFAFDNDSTRSSGNSDQATPPQCCGKDDGPFRLYHPDVKTCCPSGILAYSASTCDAWVITIPNFVNIKPNRLHVNIATSTHNLKWDL